MSDDRDLLLSFRAKTDKWADCARAEAKAVRVALAEGPQALRPLRLPRAVYTASLSLYGRQTPAQLMLL
jgi:hypothetical protein